MEKHNECLNIPRNVLQAIDTIYEYLPKSLLTEICITKQDGTFCIPISSTSPSPPPDDVCAEQSVARKILRLTTKKKTAKLSQRSPEQVRQALKTAMQILVIPKS